MLCSTSSTTTTVTSRNHLWRSTPKTQHRQWLPTSTWVPLSLSSSTSSTPSFPRFLSLPVRAARKASEKKVEEKIVEQEEEEELPWLQDKALDLVEFTGSLTNRVPGPRVAQTFFPWLLVIPFAFLGVTFISSLVKTVKKFNSPRHKRRQLVNTNKALNKAIDELFQKGREEVQHSALVDLMKKTGNGMEDVLRKYIRYALNEKPFNADTVVDLIQLRKASMLTDSEVAGVLNEISRRIVNDKGPVVMDVSGYTEKGFKRKLAVQALFGKVFYLSELPDFCSKDSSLIVKEIFGVTDEDADKLRLHTLSDAGDMETLEKMAEDIDPSDAEGSDPENSDE